MKILLSDTGTQKDITQQVETVVWSGDYKQAARKLELKIASSPKAPNISISTGQSIMLLNDDGNELFRGIIFTQEKDRTANLLTVTVYDELIYLLKSRITYNFKMITAEGITRRIADDYSIPLGDLAETGTLQNIILRGESPYAGIMKAYTAVSRQNGKKYLPRMKNGKLEVVEKGTATAKYVLAANSNITSAKYKESIEDMVNLVKIYDGYGNYFDEVKNEDWRKTYGLIQNVYYKEEDKEPYTVAENMLKGLAQEGYISALGDSECITGNAVQVKESYTGLTGLFYIDTDKHIWEKGHHRMELGLHFKNIMDDKEL